MRRFKKINIIILIILLIMSSLTGLASLTQVKVTAKSTSGSDTTIEQLDHNTVANWQNPSKVFNSDEGTPISLEGNKITDNFFAKRLTYYDDAYRASYGSSNGGFWGLGEKRYKISNFNLDNARRNDKEFRTALPINNTDQDGYTVLIDNAIQENSLVSNTSLKYDANNPPDFFTNLKDITTHHTENQFPGYDYSDSDRKTSNQSQQTSGSLVFNKQVDTSKNFSITGVFNTPRSFDDAKTFTYTNGKKTNSIPGNGGGGLGFIIQSVDPSKAGVDPETGTPSDDLGINGQVGTTFIGRDGYVDDNTIREYGDYGWEFLSIRQTNSIGYLTPKSPTEVTDKAINGETINHTNAMRILPEVEEGTLTWAPYENQGDSTKKTGVLTYTTTNADTGKRVQEVSGTFTLQNSIAIAAFGAVGSAPNGGHNRKVKITKFSSYIKQTPTRIFYRDAEGEELRNPTMTHLDVGDTLMIPSTESKQSNKVETENGTGHDIYTINSPKYLTKNKQRYRLENPGGKGYSVTVGNIGASSEENDLYLRYTDKSKYNLVPYDFDSKKPIEDTEAFSAEGKIDSAITPQKNITVGKTNYFLDPVQAKNLKVPLANNTDIPVYYKKIKKQTVHLRYLSLDKKVLIVKNGELVKADDDTKFSESFSEDTGTVKEILVPTNINDGTKARYKKLTINFNGQVLDENGKELPSDLIDGSETADEKTITIPFDGKHKAYTIIPFTKDKDGGEIPIANAETIKVSDGHVGDKISDQASKTLMNGIYKRVDSNEKVKLSESQYEVFYEAKPSEITIKHNLQNNESESKVEKVKLLPYQYEIDGDGNLHYTFYAKTNIKNYVAKQYSQTVSYDPDNLAKTITFDYDYKEYKYTIIPVDENGQTIPISDKPRVYKGNSGDPIDEDYKKIEIPGYDLDLAKMYKVPDKNPGQVRVTYIPKEKGTVNLTYEGLPEQYLTEHADKFPTKLEGKTGESYAYSSLTPIAIENVLYEISGKLQITGIYPKPGEDEYITIKYEPVVNGKYTVYPYISSDKTPNGDKIPIAKEYVESFSYEMGSSKLKPIEKKDLSVEGYKQASDEDIPADVNRDEYYVEYVPDVKSIKVDYQWSKDSKKDFEKATLPPNQVFKNIWLNDVTKLSPDVKQVIQDQYANLSNSFEFETPNLNNSDTGEKYTYTISPDVVKSDDPKHKVIYTVNNNQTTYRVTYTPNVGEAKLIIDNDVINQWLIKNHRKPEPIVDYVGKDYEFKIPEVPGFTATYNGEKIDFTKPEQTTIKGTLTTVDQNHDIKYKLIENSASIRYRLRVKDKSTGKSIDLKYGTTNEFAGFKEGDPMYVEFTGKVGETRDNLNAPILDAQVLKVPMDKDGKKIDLKSYLELSNLAQDMANYQNYLPIVPTKSHTFTFDDVHSEYPTDKLNNSEYFDYVDSMKKYQIQPYYLDDKFNQINIGDPMSYESVADKSFNLTQAGTFPKLYLPETANFNPEENKPDENGVYKVRYTKALKYKVRLRFSVPGKDDDVIYYNDEAPIVKTGIEEIENLDAIKTKMQKDIAEELKDYNLADFTIPNLAEALKIPNLPNEGTSEYEKYVDQGYLPIEVQVSQKYQPTMPFTGAGGIYQFLAFGILMLLIGLIAIYYQTRRYKK